MKNEPGEFICDLQFILTLVKFLIGFIHDLDEPGEFIRF